MVDLDVAVRVLTTIELVEVESTDCTGRAVNLYRPSTVLLASLIVDVLNDSLSSFAIGDILFIDGSVSYKLTDRLNAPVQGTAADGLKLALALLWERRNECPGAGLVLVCHDEVVVECDANKAEEAIEWLVQAMKDGMDADVNVMEPHIPIEVEASVSRTWGG